LSIYREEGETMVPPVIEKRYSQLIHPLHAVLLAGTLPLFFGALLSDMAYASSYEIQWNNFASWLIAGGLVFAGIALVFTIVDLCCSHRRASGLALYSVILLALWVIGFLNALMHARDAWASMPTGLVLSAIVAVLAAAATWLGFCTPHHRGVKQ